MRLAGFLISASLAGLAIGVSPSLAADADVDPAALRMGQKVAKCLVERQRNRVEWVIASLPQSDAAREAYIAAKPQDCMPTHRGPGHLSLSLPGHFWRGALAERLLLNDFVAIGKPASGHVSPVFPSVGADLLQTMTDIQKREVVMINFAECVVAAEPAKSYGLFGTEIGSQDEKGAIQALAHTFSTCIPAGETVQLKVPVLRSFLAEGAYRVSVAKVGDGPSA